MNLYPIKVTINGALRKLGYEINDVSRRRLITRNGFEQYKFVRPDGSFDYEQYRELQVGKNKREIDYVWVKEENIAYLSQYLKSHVDRPIRFGVCHGSKRGREQEWFNYYLGQGQIIGTDISETAKDFPNSVQWDFHEVKLEWIDAVDFIYSNALDHSYDPEKAINAWLQCVRPGGYCIVEWHTFGESVNITDPFSSDLVQLVYALTNWGKGRYCVREIIPTVQNPEFIKFVVLYKF